MPNQIRCALSISYYLINIAITIAGTQFTFTFEFVLLPLEGLTRTRCSSKVRGDLTSFTSTQTSAFVACRRLPCGRVLWRIWKRSVGKFWSLYSQHGRSFIIFKHLTHPNQNMQMTVVLFSSLLFRY